MILSREVDIVYVSYQRIVEDVLGYLEGGKLLSVVAIVRMRRSDQGLHALTTYLPHWARSNIS